MEKIESNNLNPEKNPNEQEVAIKEAMTQVSEAYISLAIAEAKLRSLLEYKNTPEDIESSRKYFEEKKISMAGIHIGAKVVIKDITIEQKRSIVVGFFKDHIAAGHGSNRSNCFLYAYRAKRDPDSRKLRISSATEDDIVKWWG